MGVVKAKILGVRYSGLAREWVSRAPCQENGPVMSDPGLDTVQGFTLYTS